MIGSNSLKYIQNLTVILVITLFVHINGFAQEKMTANTLKLTSDAPPASVSDVSWLKGNWTNKTVNSTMTQIWDAPAMGIMKGSYKVYNGDELTTYQILTIYEESNKLMLRIQDVRKTTDGKEMIETAGIHPLVKLTISRAFFEGLTFEQVNMNRIIIYRSRMNGDGNSTEQKDIFFRDGADRCLI